MIHNGDIPFLSEEGKVINISQKSLLYSELLDMLYRNSHKRPIKTGVRANDLVLAVAICDIGLSPCPYQTLIRPDEFSTFHALCDYMGIDVDEDSNNEYINDFLVFLGHDPLPEYVEDPYEGWTEEMIAEQEQDDREVDATIKSELAEELAEENRCDFY